LAGSQPDKFIWMGAASGVSNQVGRVMRATQSEWRVAKSNNNKLLATIAEQMVNALGAGNKAVYDDLYWQHLAFQSGGIALMRQFAQSGQIEEQHLAGWEKIVDAAYSTAFQDRETLTMKWVERMRYLRRAQGRVVEKCSSP
jgi:hypothetical protein